ncbi:14702_t:CDS:1, partial [Dentiscutata heterogama]
INLGKLTLVITIEFMFLDQSLLIKKFLLQGIVNILQENIKPYMHSGSDINNLVKNTHDPRKLKEIIDYSDSSVDNIHE